MQRSQFSSGSCGVLMGPYAHSFIYMYVWSVCIDSAIVNLIWLNVPRARTKQNLLTFHLLVSPSDTNPQPFHSFEEGNQFKYFDTDNNLGQRTV